MIKHVGHGGILLRIAINVGAGYLPGINTVIQGASQTAGLLGELYKPDDYKTPSDKVVKRFQAIIDEAFGRT
jgi:hypothetical protein